MKSTITLKLDVPKFDLIAFAVAQTIGDIERNITLTKDLDAPYGDTEALRDHLEELLTFLTDEGGRQGVLPASKPKEDKDTILEIPTKEVVKLIKAELALDFGKDAKFSVRSKRGIHDSIVVTWKGYPPEQKVRAAIDHFRGGELDQLDSWHYKPRLYKGRMVQFGNVSIMYERRER